MDTIEEKLCRDLALRGMRPNTIITYARCCRRFAAHSGRSALELTAADVRAYPGVSARGRAPEAGEEMPRGGRPCGLC